MMTFRTDERGAVVCRLDDEQTRKLEEADGVRVQIEDVLKRHAARSEHVIVMDANGRIRGEVGTLERLLASPSGKPT